MPGLTWISPLSIPTRLIVVVVAAVAPLLALITIGAGSDRSHALRAASEEVLNFARLTAERQSRVFDDARVLLSTLRMTPSIDTVGSAACQETVARIAAQNRQFMTIGVVRADGMIVCHNVARQQVRFGDATLLENALAGAADDFFVGGLTIGRITGRPTIITARALRSDDGAAAGIVFASIDLSGLSAVAEASSDATGKHMMIVDAGNGKVVAGTGTAEGMIGKPYDDAGLLAALKTIPFGGTTEARGPTGEDEIIGFAPLRASGISHPVVVVGVPRKVALAEANNAAVSDIALAIGTATSALLVTWLLGYWTLVHPIRKLSLAADRFGNGDLLARAEMEPWQSREMRSLATTLNHMAERLDSTNRQLETLANEDGLTGLANRRRFDDALATECRRSERSGRPVSLLLIDVDHFKSYNDLFGHLAGDDCLKRLADCLKACASRPGDVAARYGGEELALILPNTSEDGAIVVARNILGAIAALKINHPRSAKGLVSVSIGVSATGGDSSRGLIPDWLIASADEALYDAKSSGRARYCSRRSGRVSLVSAAG